MIEYALKSANIELTPVWDFNGTEAIHRPLSLVLPENSIKLEWIQKLISF